MKRIILILILSLIVLGAFSQEVISSKTKTTKELRTEQNKAENELTALSVERMVTNHQFYLEVTFMSDRSKAFSQSSGMIDVSSQKNYIAIDSNKIIMQVEPNTYLTTNWGIDNLPKRGNFLHYDLSKAEKTDEGYFIRFNTTGDIGNLAVTMTVLPTGQSELKMLGNNGSALTFRGILIPLNQSRISSSNF
jgi:hypothetical protein